MGYLSCFMATKVPITVAHGDGIGPEIMAATLHIIQEASNCSKRVEAAGLDFIKIENLCTFDGQAGYSLSQGQSVTTQSRWWASSWEASRTGKPCGTPTKF